MIRRFLKHAEATHRRARDIEYKVSGPRVSQEEREVAWEKAQRLRNGLTEDVQSFLKLPMVRTAEINATGTSVITLDIEYGIAGGRDSEGMQYEPDEIVIFEFQWPTLYFENYATSEMNRIRLWLKHLSDR